MASWLEYFAVGCYEDIFDWIDKLCTVTVACVSLITVWEITFVVQGDTLSERYKICMEMCRFVQTICYKLCISQ